jgi:hypothetical protein
MGGGGSRGTSSTSPQVPEDVRRLMGRAVPQQEAALEQAPLQGFVQPRPAEIAGLTPEQQDALAVFTERLGGPTLHAPEAQATEELQRRIAAPIGEAPGTQAIRSFLEHQTETRALPSLMSELSLAGLGRSGAVASGVADLEAAKLFALAPALQQEVADRQRAVEQLFGVGEVMERRPTERAGAAFEAGETARMIEQARLDAQLADYIRRQNLIENITNVTTGALVPASFGQKGRQETHGGGLLGGAITGSAK